MQTMTIGSRFCGPPNAGNGGYVCGMLARHIPGAAAVTLRALTPLETPLVAVAQGNGSWELRDGETAVAIGRPAVVAVAQPETASFDEATAAEKDPVIKAHEHLLPLCFVCGPQRNRGDGLRIEAGRLARRTAGGGTLLAATWTPAPNLGGGDGFVAPEFLWAALDCPTGYAAILDASTGRADPTPVLLGTLAARIDALPRLGERCVITAWETGRDGRKRFAEAAAFGAAGQLLAVAQATWITVPRQAQLTRT